MEEVAAAPPAVKHQATETELPAAKAARAGRSAQRAMERRPSRASSVDRREIFKKYIQNANEHTERLRPYANDDPELRRPKGQPARQDEKEEEEETKAGPPCEAASSARREFRLVRLRNDFESDLGIFIARSQQPDIGCQGYYVAFVLPDGLVKRYVSESLSCMGATNNPFGS